MWAITPEGRATNLGEVLPNDDDNSTLDVTSELQAFGLIVTAEPYFAVTQPSDMVVMENIIRTDTVGKIEEIDAKYELLQRGQYTLNVPPASLRPIELDRRTPLELLEARNAVRIARWNGADRYAADTMAKAEQQLQQAEDYRARKAGRKPVIMTAREAVQTAEDARIIASKRQIEEQAAAERQAGADREARAERERVAAEQAKQTGGRSRATGSIGRRSSSRPRKRSRG